MVSVGREVMGWSVWEGRCWGSQCGKGGDGVVSVGRRCWGSQCGKGGDGVVIVGREVMGWSV